MIFKNKKHLKVSKHNNAENLVENSNSGNIIQYSSNTANTTLPNTTKTQTPFLIRTDTNEKIFINKPLFRIGRECCYVDYFTGYNCVAISRCHAIIYSLNGNYFIEDTNSTNHTYVNDEMIPSSIKVKIEHGTKIKLANITFFFHLY